MENSTDRTYTFLCFLYTALLTTAFQDVNESSIFDFWPVLRRLYKLHFRLLDGSVKVRHSCHIVVLNIIFDNSLPADAYYGEIQSSRIRWKPNAISRLPKDAENLQADPVALRAATEHVT